MEDDSEILQLAARIFVKGGYDVDTATNGQRAWEMIQVKCYDILVTDHEMPQLSGVELLKRLQMSQMDLPVVMITGSFPELAFRRHCCLQPENILLKPFTAQELLRTVTRVIAAAAERMEQGVARPRTP